MKTTLGLLLALLVSMGTALAKDDFIWGSFGGGQGYYQAPYVGFGFMADTWGAEIGLVTRSDYHGDLYSHDPGHSDITLIAEDQLVTPPFYLSVLKGYAPNERIAFYTSLGLLLANRCDIVESDHTHWRYCTNETSEVNMIPGVGALFSMGELTVGMGYQYGIGPLVSVGTDF